MVTKEEMLELLATQYNRFLFDQMYSSEQMDTLSTGSAAVEPKIFELALSTGVLENSTAKAYYNQPLFNPVYATAYARFFMNSTADVFAFVGFKETNENPTLAMVESHQGLMINNGKLYASSADGSEQQRVEISGIDPTKDMIYKIKANAFSTFPLPQVIPYFDGFRIITPDRIWTEKARTANVQVKDQVHYFMFFIKNSVNVNKILRLKALTYGEDYAD